MTIIGEDVKPLDEFEKEEWRNVCRAFKPHLSDAEFDADFDKAWAGFVELKAQRGRQ